MRTQETIENYQACIETIAREMKRGAEERQWLGEWEGKLKFREAQILTSEPPEGKNAEERAAHMLQRVTTDDLCTGHREAVWVCRARIDNADMQVMVAREQCRLYRLQLALSASPAVLEAVA